MMGWRFYQLSLSVVHTFIIALTLLQPHPTSLASASVHSSSQSISSLHKPLAASSQHHFHTLLTDDNDTTLPAHADSASLARVTSTAPLAASLQPGGGATVARAKRDRPSWNDLQGYWGKRDDEARPAWSNFRGSWGKKADWSSLRGSWGKRSGDMRGGWSGLRGSWGKRAGDDLLADVDTDLPSDLSKRAGWSSLQGSWGKRDEGVPTTDKRAGWSSLQGSWGKRNSVEGENSLLPQMHPTAEEEDSEESSGKQFQAHLVEDAEEDVFMHQLATLLAQSYAQKQLLRQGPSSEMLSNGAYLGQQDEGEEVNGVVPAAVDGVEDVVDSSVAVDKRGSPRQYVSTGWLKRPDGLIVAPRSTNWSSLRGSWGKRGGPGSWSQMRGTWGKRPDLEKWSSLRGSWGKRGGEPGWSNLRGSWGKRDLGSVSGEQNE